MFADLIRWLLQEDKTSHFCTLYPPVSGGSVRITGVGSENAYDSMTLTLLAIDPGRAKCGLAVVSGTRDGSPSEPVRCLERAVVETERLTLAVGELLRRRPEITQLLLGDGTHSATLRRALAETFPLLPLRIVNEHNTSQRAKARFLAENRAPGWRRLLPRGLRSPEVPYDDYAALMLAEDYFSK